MSLADSLPALSPVARRANVEVVTHRLANGVEVWIVPRREIPLVSARLVVRGGRTLDPAHEPGFADLLAAALKEGTLHRTGPELAGDFQAAGGELFTAATDDALVAGSTVLAAHGDALVSLLHEVVAAPAFPDAGIARVRSLAAEELETDESDPAFLASRAFRQALYDEHPYGRTRPGLEVIEALTLERLRLEAARRLTPDRTLLVIVGDVDTGGVFRTVEATFGAWSAEAEPLASHAAPAPENTPPALIRIVDRPGSVQTVLMVGNVGVSRLDADAFPLELATTIYGASFSSRLVANLREDKGYTYSPRVSSRWLALRGPVQTIAAVRNEVTGAALAEILYELSRMGSTEVTDEELLRARSRDAGAHAIALESAEALAAALASLWLSGLAPDSLDRYVDALASIDKPALRRVARRYLSPGRARIVAVGDAALIRAELAPFGVIDDTGP
ncbi:MAG: pitrilysin family protein [Thermoanaerobaculia bacterium]